MRATDYPYFQHRFVALAHRGGAAYQPNVGRENTAHAFHEAEKLGYLHFETDVHATADGVLMAFHDERLDRVTDATGAIAELPYREVHQARIHGVDPIPTLAELLESFPGANFNIDIKAPGAVQPLAKTIVDHRAQGRVCVGSFDITRMNAFRRLVGNEVPTAATRLGIAWYAYAPVLNRMLASAGVALQIPRTRPGGTLPVLSRHLIASAHAAGRHVHVWTIDDPDEMHELIDMGVDGIVSDRIDVLKGVLEERGLWEGQ